MEVNLLEKEKGVQIDRCSLRMLSSLVTSVHVRCQILEGSREEEEIRKGEGEKRRKRRRRRGKIGVEKGEEEEEEEEEVKYERNIRK